MRLFTYKRFWLVLLLPAGFAALRVMSRFPAFVETVYSRGIYMVLSGVFGRLTSLVPVSLFHLSLIVVPVAAIALVLWRRTAGKRRNRKRRLVLSYAQTGSKGNFTGNHAVCRQLHGGEKRRDAARMIATLLALAGVIYFIFIVVCAPNYHRLSFAEQSGLDVYPSSADELAALCAQLVEKANHIRQTLPEDENGVMALELSDFALAKRAQALYANAAAEYPALSGYVARPKPAIFSRFMSYTSISGIYMAFFFEANVNVDVVDFNIPVTMMHELSHFKGYMREDEANFIAYLACKYSGDPAFIYSGTMLALIHSSNALYGTDRDLYWEAMEPLLPAVRADLAANNAYWSSFDGPVAEVSTAMNDMYLKTNNQANGVKSYGAMVDLLLAEARRGSPFDVPE